MFEDGGILYVYKIYGIHHCVNIVTETKGKGCAVLIRAIVPILGIDIMKNLRNNENIKTLCKGPGNLTKAFDFNTNDNFKSVCSNELFLQDFKHISNNEIITTERIGITKSKELKLRYFNGLERKKEPDQRRVQASFGRKIENIVKWSIPSVCLTGTFPIFSNRFI